MMPFEECLFWTAVAVSGLSFALGDDIRYWIESRKHSKNDEFVDLILYQDEFHCPFNSKRKRPKN